MKINFIPTIIAITLSVLIAYGFYNFNDGENKILLSLGGFAFLATTLVGSIGINYEQSRTTTNIRAVSGVFFTVAFTSNLIFNFLNFSKPSYIIINGILFLMFILIVYSINKVKQ